LISFHIESSIDIFEYIKIIKEKKCIASLAINPKTTIEHMIPFLNVIHHFLIMSVEPGFSGQSFLPEVISKIDTLVAYRYEQALDFRIGVDGGINKTNIKYLAKKGVDDFAISNGIFEQSDPVQALNELYSLVKDGIRDI
jgi:ribulose-phosphate 3-epimerase